MESTSQTGRIQCSESSYRLLSNDPSHSSFKIVRRGKVQVKGKGDMTTYWIEPTGVKDGESTRSMEQQEKLIAWNVNNLENFVKAVFHRNQGRSLPESLQEPSASSQEFTIGSVLDWPSTLIPFDITEKNLEKRPSVASDTSSESIEMDAEIKAQITDLVMAIAHLYKNHSFHSFEHASHITMAVVKLMVNLPPSNPFYVDPLARLAVVFACLVCDLDHPAKSNAQLVAEGTELAQLYGERSIAEQNSIDLTWGLFTDDQFETIRNILCPTPVELRRFYQLFVKALLSTDMADKELNSLRQESWKKAFESCTEVDEERRKQSEVRRANATLELIMQAACSSYAMQQWAVYHKWNSRLYLENMLALESAQKTIPTAASPMDGWFMGQLAFFDNVVLPLARRLRDLGLPLSYLRCATENKEQWLLKGKEVVQELKGLHIIN